MEINLLARFGLARGDYLLWLRAAILGSHHCQGTHHSTRSVRLVDAERIIWQGEVEIFELTDHPIARQCYAWGQIIDGEFRAICVLGLLPVKSPKAAVQIALSTGTVLPIAS